MANQFQTRNTLYNTSSGWTSDGTILGFNTTGVETDTGKTKRGDGLTAWTSLAYDTDIRQRRRRFGAHKTPGTAATLTGEGGMPTHTLTGTASNVSDSTGHYVKLSGDGAIAGIQIASTEVIKTENGPVATFVIKTGTTLPTDATERIWIGFSSADLTAVDSPTGNHVMAFRLGIDADTTAFWRTVTNDGGADTGTVTVTTIAIAAATRYVLTIDASNPAAIQFLVDGVLAAIHTTNLPTVTQALGTQCFALDAGSGVMELLISKIAIETN